MYTKGLRYSNLINLFTFFFSFSFRAVFIMFLFSSNESKTPKYIFPRVEEGYFEYFSISFYLFEKERIFDFFMKLNTIFNKKGDWK